LANGNRSSSLSSSTVQGSIPFDQDPMLGEHMELAFKPLLLAAAAGRAQFGLMAALGQHAGKAGPGTRVLDQDL
jgi:hypothetical protein